MAFIPLPNGIKVVMEFTYDGQLVANVYHVRSTNPITTVNLTALAQIFVDWFDNNLADVTVTTLFLNRVVATDISVPDGLQGEVVLSSPSTGQISSPGSPGNVSICTSIRSGFAGRSTRGRKYWCGIPESMTVLNEISVVNSAAFSVRAIQLWDDLDAEGYEWVIASFRNAGADREEGVAYSIATWQTDIFVDSQRRRLTGRGI